MIILGGGAMTGVDWAVWPIFLLQAIALLFLLLPQKTRFLGFATRHIVLFLLVIVSVAIVVSLFYDSTTALHLYF